ncbi:MAG: sulfoxide reductase heme-binding subunit YedZ [Psychromonas sp.]|nr:sulfoxide reductase heme-binding subunit YedZ [Psychromonas sp.]
MKFSKKHLFFLKILIHLAYIFTFIYLWYLLDQDLLGGDPIKELTHFLGKTALNSLLLTLAVTPISRRFKQPVLMQTRRLIGLYTFFWATLHVLVFARFELSWDLTLFFSEVYKRPYLTLGAIAWFILVLLSITSIGYIRKKMKKSWLTLHRFVYLAIILIVIHYFWSVKSGLIEPSIYIAICLLLLSERRAFCKFKN